MYKNLLINRVSKDHYRSSGSYCFGIRIVCLFNSTTRKNNSYASLPDAEKSKVQDALKNMGVDVTLDPTTGEILVPVEDYHRSRISLAAKDYQAAHLMAILL